MLRRVLESTCQPQHFGLGRVIGGVHGCDGHLAGGHRAGLVEHDGVDAPGRFQHLRALDQDAQLRAASGSHQQGGRRGQPERARAGDDQDGDGGREGRGGRSAEQQPGGQRQQGQPDDDRHEDRRDPIGQPLHLGLAALGFGDEPGDLGELGVGADAGRADLEPSSDVDRRADDAVAGTHLDGHGLTGQHRRVHRRRARNHDAVGGDLLAGACDEYIADGELVYGNACFGRSVAQDSDVLGAQVEQCAQRRAGLPLGARLEIAPGEDEGGDGGGDFQIEMRVRRRCSAKRLSVIFMPGVPAWVKSSAQSDQR